MSAYHLCCIVSLTSSFALCYQIIMCGRVPFTHLYGCMYEHLHATRIHLLSCFYFFKFSVTFSCPALPLCTYCLAPVYCTPGCVHPRVNSYLWTRPYTTIQCCTTHT